MTKLTIDGYKNKNQNKYYKWYLNIIKNRLKCPVTEKYKEKHHILPKCIGGNDNKENIVNLSAREHFIVHYLLTKFIYGKDRHKLVLAFHALSIWKNSNRKNKHKKINSRLYEYLKKEISEANSKRSKEMWQNQEFKSKMSKIHKKSWENDKQKKQLKYMKENSPLKNPETHNKTMKTRKERGTNIWVTNNPMKNKEFALEVASKRSGESHYSKKTVEYFFKYSDDEDWKKIPHRTFHKFRKENNLTRGKMQKLIEGEDVGINLQVKKVEYENKENN